MVYSNQLFFIKKILLIITIFFITVLPFYSSAALQIDSIRTTISNCPNNGSITIFASTTTPSILYSIIAGPLTQPVQTSSFFNSLPAGTYTIKIINAASETITQDVTIAGNYVQLDFNPVGKSPYCVGGNDGQIIGGLIAGTGNGPYTWQLIAPSPIVAGPQASDTFSNLIAGNYTVRVTDACGSFRTIVATITNPNTLFYFQFSTAIEIIGCDSGLITIPVKFPYNTPRLPLSYKYQTKNGIFIPLPGSQKIDSSQLPGYIYIQQIIPNITYGDTVITTVYNDCGDSAVINNFIDPFDFHPLYSYDSCGRIAHVDFNYIKDPSYFYGLKAPATFTLIEYSTNALIDSGTLNGDSLYRYYNMITGISTGSNVITGNTYTLTVTDGCGKIFSNNYTVPPPLPASVISAELLQTGCIDSVIGVVRIHISGFKENTRLVILSGPAAFGSTKPGFSYTDTYTYPDTMAIPLFTTEYFFLNTVAPGTYRFKVIDDCGNDIPASFTINPTDVSSLGKTLRYEKGCLGQNKIFYSAIHGDTLNYINNGGGVKIVTTNISTNSIIKSQLYYGNVVSDSILNLPSGTYEISFGFEQSGYGTYINDSIHECLNLRDTIIIEGYQTPAISTSNSILCHNTINIQLIPDSSKGVPPYQYEIIAGPQTFPVQNSNVFTVNSAGVYTARIYDICGNASTASITADTLTFPPIIPQQNTCNSIQLFYGSAPYFTYTWTRPNNQSFSGDTLTLNPVTAADTGIYRITRMVDINGCRDTIYTDYHLIFPITYNQTKVLCFGNSVTIGSHTYTTTGIFRDTLISSKGCDSIVVLNLTINPLKRDTVTKAICVGQSISIGTHTYNQTGIYRDTLSTNTCDSIVVLNLTINPLKRDTVTKAICVGQSISIGTHIYNQTGIYRDTLSTNTCDSIVVLNLTINPIKRDTVTKAICVGQSISIGTHTYYQTGIYRDTLSTSNCDSIVVLNLTINPLKRDTVTKAICVGQSISIGTHTYNQTGIYRDTLSTSTCDSIVVLNLTINPLKRDTLIKAICFGQSVTIGTHTYNQTGIYKDTLSTETCDSIVLLNLTVTAKPFISISANPLVVDAGGIVQLNTTLAASYLWASVASLNSTTIQNPRATLLVSSWIYLQATFNPGNCIAFDSVFIIVRLPDTTAPCNGNSYIYMPNAFSPNGDTKNEVFKINANNIRLKVFQVFNRWGEIVFTTSNINQPWDGTYKGRILPGNYVYFISYFDCNLTTPKIIKGNVILIR